MHERTAQKSNALIVSHVAYLHTGTLSDLYLNANQPIASTPYSLLAARVMGLMQPLQSLFSHMGVY
ncbi:MAG: hypothetical protein ACPHE1_01575, partial [Pseudomonadales bacterium]